jgi:DNA-binding beta-propeller fold protein YncE
MSSRSICHASGARQVSLALALALATGCSLPGFLEDDDDSSTDEPELPRPAVYVRGSLTPLYQLTPTAEMRRFDILGTRMLDADFTTTARGFVTQAEKMDEIAAQIGEERGRPVTIVGVADRLRAERMPFRGNPSDVELVAGRAFVPLGGDLGTPGNEVAIAPLDGGEVSRVRVGVRPLRVAAADGLVFVCNQYSNYVSIIDAGRGEPLLDDAGAPVEIATDYYCTDLLLAPADGAGRFDLYLANSWRGSVLRYRVEIAGGARPTVRVVEPAAADPISTPAAEIAGAGANPSRLSLSDDGASVYVANNRGGEIARIVRADDRVDARMSINGASIDILEVGDRVFVPTTTIDRGLLDRDEPRPASVDAPPVEVTGLDGQPAIAHPGAMFDGTRSYNFEDLRNGVVQLDPGLAATSLRYLTDDISPEPNFAPAQKVLTGAVPQAIAKNQAASRIYLAHGSSNQVQELSVVAGEYGLAAVAGGTFATSARPYALALDEDAGRLAVATWGGELLEVFDLATRTRLAQIDLGYAALATAPYPATNIERGQDLFVRADWSNNGRKACATCHVDELQVDGVGFANGATAPTAYHQVRPNWNLQTTDSYFWNGSFKNGSYASLAFLAQSRTNCELVLFGLVEGPGSDPAARVGDPNNRVTDGRDAECRPGPVVDGLPDNFDAIVPIIAAQKLVAAQVIQDQTGLPRADVTRLIDFYGVAQVRLPPNPLRYLYESEQLGQVWQQALATGEQLFGTCAGCHQPDNQRSRYTDGKQHGRGADWPRRFVDAYVDDDRVEIPLPMLDALTTSASDPEINTHTPLDYFQPFCFSATDCLIFEDPLAAVGDLAEESRRLDLLARINLEDPERGFVPGNVVGQPQINTPSLRGVWWQPNILHHGLARSIHEAILAPGHPALREGETGFARNAEGQIDVHGQTSGFTPDQVDALALFVESIE